MGWKDELLGSRWWHYGKLIRGKATWVSLDFLPNFYALSENYGNYENDYLEEYRSGRLSAEAKTVYEVLLQRGALDAVRLRKEAHMSSDASKSRYDRALTELQVGLKVLPIGIAEAGAWRSAFIYEVLPCWLPNVPKAARHISRTQARHAILGQYIDNVIATTLESATRVFSWTLAEMRATAEVLADEERISLNVNVAGIRELQMVTNSDAQ